MHFEIHEPGDKQGKCIQVHKSERLMDCPGIPRTFSHINYGFHLHKEETLQLADPG